MQFKTLLEAALLLGGLAIARPVESDTPISLLTPLSLSAPEERGPAKRGNHVLGTNGNVLLPPADDIKAKARHNVPLKDEEVDGDVLLLGSEERSEFEDGNNLLLGTDNGA